MQAVKDFKSSESNAQAPQKLLESKNKPSKINNQTIKSTPIQKYEKAKKHKNLVQISPT